ncbi:MAG: HEPN domain-containing protein [Eubacterium sp.]|nr:HEPN domain-containing protein [Eubacterium sp.]
MNDVLQEWLKYIEQDLSVAKHLYDKFYPKPFEIICYHCEQAAEKAVKMLIVNKGSQGGLPRSHDISFLLNQINHMYSIPDEYYDYADTLSKYGVAARYPNELFLDDFDAMEAIKYSEKIVSWAKSQLND